MGAFGRAQRDVRSDGHEEWIFEPGDRALAEELVALQARKALGGFASLEDAGDGRVRLVRADGARTVERSEGAVPWREAIGLLETFAGALAEHERRTAKPVAIGPTDFVLGPVAHLRADALVAEMVGAEAGEKRPPARFTPPDQVDGAPWDDAARRYVLGLVAYRLLAGALPFAGEGLRRDLDERATRGVPPFADAVAGALKPGVQSLVLRMLAPRASDRPRSAVEVARECAALLAETRPGRRRRDVRLPAAARAERRATPKPAARSRQRLLAGALVLAGVLVATLGALARTSVGEPKRAPIAPVALRGTRAADCAGCHPREVSEWKRSVMAHASKSPLFGALESAVEEQVARTSRCPFGAGVLRPASAAGDACFDERSGLRVTGAGGEGWCINCHAPAENLGRSAPAWSALGSGVSREPLRDVLAPASLDGVSCAVCHQTIGPVGPHRAGAAYEGNPSWTSFVTGAEFLERPEDRASTFGVSNSGYLLDPRAFRNAGRDAGAIVHGAASARTSAYLRSSEFCGACHDVRLFGTDVLGVAERGEHFKRLRNAYSEWRAWAETERSAGREPATCQGCHMSQYPGVCVPAKGAAGGDDCPKGTRFEPRPPVVDPRAVSHYFTSVEVPLTPGYPEAFATDPTLDAFGVPVGLRERRDRMLRHVFSLAIEPATRSGDSLRVPLRIENVGAGHRVPAGFSQEREIWIELEVRDARGALVYQVGHVDRPDEDLADKRFLRVTTSDDVRDGLGRPLGLFGADVIDGPDVQQWSPSPSLGGTRFEGKGLVNFQNGFLRCVRCIGTIDASGRCQPGEGQGRTRADRFADGAYDIDTGECRSNLAGTNALFETYFPIGSLDADRGVLRAPDAIIDTRSAPPGVPVFYTYLLDAAGHPAPLHVRATLHFRAFPPFLLRAFADYEQRMAARGLRPSGAQVTRGMLEKLEVLDLATAEADVP
jgi:hypothetical protein